MYIFKQCWSSMSNGSTPFQLQYLHPSRFSGVQAVYRYAMLRYAMLCYAALRAMRCYAMLLLASFPGRFLRGQGKTVDGIYKLYSSNYIPLMLIVYNQLLFTPAMSIVSMMNGLFMALQSLLALPK